MGEIRGQNRGASVITEGRRQRGEGEGNMDREKDMNTKGKGGREVRIE